ncbi:calcium-binding protein, partial [Endozoicomonas sp. ONNA1]
MALMDRVSGHLDDIEVSDRFNRVRQAAGDKGLLADAFLLLEQGRFAAVATEDPLDTPEFRKKLLDLFRQTLRERQGLTPEQAIDRVVTLLNDSGYSADDTRYLKGKLLGNREFMEQLRTGGDGADPNDIRSGKPKSKWQKFTNTLGKISNSKKYVRSRRAYGSGMSVAGLVSGIQTLENLEKYGDALSDETRNLAYAGAGLSIGGSVYSAAMTAHWLLSGSKRIGKAVTTGTTTLKTMKTTTRASRASRFATTMVPGFGNAISIASAAVSIAASEKSAEEARKSGNHAQVGYHRVMIALSAISIGLDVLGLALDFICPKLGILVDLISEILGWIQTAIAECMPPNNAYQEFEAILASDGFNQYIDDMAGSFEEKGFSRFEYHADATEFLDQRKFEENLEELLISRKRSLSGTKKGLAFLDSTNRKLAKAGTKLADHMVGKKGFKIFYGLGGNDTLVADEGELHGGSGHDQLILETGEAYGGRDNDVIRIKKTGKAYGGPGDDDIWIGESGKAYGGRGNDVLRLPHEGVGYGGPGNDTLINGRLQDGGSGHDLLLDDLGRIKQVGGAGNDRFKPGIGRGIIIGGPGNDTLIMPTEIKIPKTNFFGGFLETGMKYFHLRQTDSVALFEVHLRSGQWRSRFAEYLEYHNLKRHAPDGRETPGGAIFSLFGVPDNGFDINPRHNYPESDLYPNKLYIASLSEIRADYQRKEIHKRLISERVLTGYDEKHTNVKRVSDKYGHQEYFDVGEVFFKHAYHWGGPTQEGHMYLSTAGLYLLSNGDLYYFSERGLRERSRREKVNESSVFYTTLCQLLETGGTVTGIETVVGSEQGLRAIGTFQPDNIYFNSGKNEAFTLGGNDFVHAGNGTGINWIHLGSGDDLALLGDGLNEVHGGP